MNWRGHLNAFAKQLEEYLDVDGILELAGYSGEKLPEAGKTEQSNQTDLKQGETKQDEIRPIDSESEPPTRPHGGGYGRGLLLLHIRKIWTF